jgi:hypothetical protein
VLRWHGCLHDFRVVVLPRPGASSDRRNETAPNVHTVAAGGGGCRTTQHRTRHRDKNECKDATEIWRSINDQHRVRRDRRQEGGWGWMDGGQGEPAMGQQLGDDGGGGEEKKHGDGEQRKAGPQATCACTGSLALSLIEFSIMHAADCARTTCGGLDRVREELKYRRRRT